MKNRHVGQILFILSSGEMSLTPVQVVEEIVRRTLDGEQVTHTVEAFGQNGARKRFNLVGDKFLVFDTIDSARAYLVENATTAIDSLCASAVEKSILFSTKEEKKNIRESRVQQYESMLLEDGTVVKVNLPKED
jgi:microcompartment protein CcmK/EutM